jgi:hypothetical protein
LWTTTPQTTEALADEAKDPILLHQYYNESDLVFIGLYRRVDTVKYDNIGFCNFQITFVPLAIFKGEVIKRPEKSLPNNKILKCIENLLF